MLQSWHGMRDGWTDGQKDRRSETSIRPQQLRCVGGIIIFTLIIQSYLKNICEVLLPSIHFLIFDYKSFVHLVILS